jgi:hypothetical protein
VERSAAEADRDRNEDTMMNMIDTDHLMIDIRVTMIDDDNTKRKMISAISKGLEQICRPYLVVIV